MCGRKTDILPGNNDKPIIGEFSNNAHSSKCDVMTLVRALIRLVFFSTMDQAKLVQGSRRGGVLLLYKGNLYARNRQRQNTIYWRCNVQSCGVFLQTGVCSMVVDRQVDVTREPSSHEHVPQGDDYEERVRLLTQMRNVATVSGHI